MRKTPDAPFPVEVLDAHGVPAADIDSSRNTFSVGGDAIADSQADKDQPGVPAIDSRLPLGVVRSGRDAGERGNSAECAEVMQTVAGQVIEILGYVRRQEDTEGINSKIAGELKAKLRKIAKTLKRIVPV